MNEIVVIGSGQAAIQTVMSLKRNEFTGSIKVIGEEDHLPYQRPPLSKDFLLKEYKPERVSLKKKEFYEENGIDLILGKRAESIDTILKEITLSDENKIRYDQLIIATGSRVRKLNVPGSDKKGIYYLRDLDDANALKQRLKKNKKMVIVGAGYIGLEVASVAASLGVEVTVIEMANRVMNRTVDPMISSYYQKLHESHGVKIHLDNGLKAFEGGDSVNTVLCSDGLMLEADLVVIGAGVLPNQEIAIEAGLECNNGIMVNEFGETSTAHVYACGDCTNHPNKGLNTRLRLESVHNAMEQSKTVANTIMGNKEPYDQVPWFWSDQYDHKLQLVGISGDHDEVVMRGLESKQKFLLFYLKNSELIAVNAINSSKEFLICRKLVANKVKISSDVIKDQSVNLNDLLL
ncbi:FAD-dependent oxidoreductase [Gammaproteobacteria bacterium]|nr:FAD-dependent oxidoreductase [Gammaproteobacteria bacterium]